MPWFANHAVHHTPADNMQYILSYAAGVVAMYCELHKFYGWQGSELQH